MDARAMMGRTVAAPPLFVTTTAIDHTPAAMIGASAMSVTRPTRT